MAVTPVDPIDALPTAPSRSQSPDTFSDDADAFLGALPAFGTQLNAAAVATEANAGAAETAATTAESAATAADAAAAAAVGATGYSATSVTSFSIGTGSKAFTTQSGKSFAASGDRVTAISRANPYNRMRGAATYSGTTLTITVDEIEGSGGPFTDWLLILSALEPLAPFGKQGVWIPAAAMGARDTSPAGIGDVETTTNKVGFRTLDFSTSAVEYAQFALRMPKSWDEGTVTFVPVWSHATAATNFGVVFAMRARAFSNDDASDAALGTAQTSTDTGGTADDIYFGPESSAITIAGTPQAEDLVLFEISREVADAGDTLAVDARLIGVTVYFTTNARNDL